MSNISMKTLSEVKMSPSVFSRGLVSSESNGVKIGFEFEVCVPIRDASGLKITNSRWKYRKSLVDLFKWITSVSDESFSPEVQFQLSQEFVKWEKRITKDFLELLSDDGFDKLTSLYAEVFNKQSLSNMTKFITSDKSETLQARLADFLELSGYEETDDYLLFLEHLDNVTRTKITNFVEQTYGSITELFKNYDLAYAPTPKDIDERFQIVKNDVAKAVQSDVANTKVHTIETAKAIPKNLTDWYVEPDATIKPDDKFNYTGAEIVSPPLKTKEAMTAFSDFYKCANKHGWLTNGSTGLHINLSIPAKIDVLKLALFMGDKYVLKAFGREASPMAVSVLDNLEKSVTIDNIVGLNRENIKRLYQSADYFADDHYASMSFETNPDTMKKNKYISFRHAGGDYLNEMPKILDTIGRFVTAMQIAADPSAHKNEYLKKLYKLANATPKDNVE